MTAWIAVLAVGGATIAIKGVGPLMFAHRPLPAGFKAITPLLAPCLLAALLLSRADAGTQPAPIRKPSPS